MYRQLPSQPSNPSVLGSLGRRVSLKLCHTENTSVVAGPQHGAAPGTVHTPAQARITKGGGSVNGKVGKALCLHQEAKSNTLGAHGEGRWPGRCSLKVWGIYTAVGWGVCECVCVRVCTREEGRHACALLGIKSNTANLEKEFGRN